MRWPNLCTSVHQLPPATSLDVWVYLSERKWKEWTDPKLEHFHHPGSYTLTTSRLVCFRVTLDNNLRQKRTDRIPAVRTVMSQWYSIQEESHYIMAREEIHTVLQPRNISLIGDPHVGRDWKCTLHLFPNNFFEKKNCISLLIWCFSLNQLAKKFVVALGSYLRGIHFKSRLRLRFFVVFLSPSRKFGD